MSEEKSARLKIVSLRSSNGKGRTFELAKVFHVVSHVQVVLLSLFVLFADSIGDGGEH